jgi:hypothetical protein
MCGGARTCGANGRYGTCMDMGGECSPGQTGTCGCGGSHTCRDDCQWGLCTGQCGCLGLPCCSGSTCNTGLTCQEGMCRAM